MLDKIKRGYKGSFGTVVDRFHKHQADKNINVPGPAKYSPEKQRNIKNVTTPFQSLVERDPFEDRKGLIPPLGIYEVNQHTIEERTKIEEEDDPDLVIQRPGFNVGASRFKKIPKRKSKIFDIRYSIFLVVSVVTGHRGVPAAGAEGDAD